MGSKDNDGRRWLRRIMPIGFVLSIALLSWVMHEPILIGAGKTLNVGTLPQKSDYVFVLLGDSETRPFIAAALYKCGLAKQVLVAQLQPIYHLNFQQPEDKVTIDALVAQDVLRNDIIALEHRCASTFDEVIALSKFLESHSNASVTIVTSDFHTRRTRWTTQQVLKEAAERCSFVAAPVDGISAENWWQSEEGFALYVTEGLKLFAYFVQYGGSSRFLIPAIIVVLFSAWLTSKYWRSKTPASG